MQPCLQDKRLETVERRAELNEQKTQSLDREVWGVMQKLDNLEKWQERIEHILSTFIEWAEKKFATKIELQEEIKLVKENKSSAWKIAMEWIKFAWVIVSGILALLAIYLQWKK